MIPKQGQVWVTTTHEMWIDVVLDDDDHWDVEAMVIEASEQVKFVNKPNVKMIEVEYQVYDPDTCEYLI